MTPGNVSFLPAGLDCVVRYQKNIEAVYSTGIAIRELIRLTVIHEVRHYSGMNEAQLKDIWLKNRQLPNGCPYNFSIHPEFNLIEDISYVRQQDAPQESHMFRFVDALFGCAHRHWTFPITAKKPGTISTTYVVCLDCGKEFPYDWKEMKIIVPAKHKEREVA